MLLDPINKFMEHPVTKRIAFLLGVGGGIIRIANIKLPGIVDPITTVLLVIIGIYLAAVFFQFLSKRILDQITVTFTLTFRELINTETQVNFQSVTAHENNYEYQAQRYGVGYSSFDVQCTIDTDGSASVVRDVEVEAFSTILELDTFY